MNQRKGGSSGYAEQRGKQHDPQGWGESHASQSGSGENQGQEQGEESFGQDDSARRGEFGQQGQDGSGCSIRRDIPKDGKKDH